MAISFVERLKAIKLTNFKFVSFEKKVSGLNDEGERTEFIEFTLETPIAEVTSSVSEYDPSSGKRVHDFQHDVEKVLCRLELIEKYESEFKFDDDGTELTGTGSYSGDMFLDLSRRGEVWLTDEKFSKLSGEFRAKKQNQKVADIIKRMEARNKA